MKIIKGLLSVIIISIIAFSCDKIEEPYKIEIAVDTNCVLPDFPVVDAFVQKVYFEEFTGHECVNCPTGAAFAHEAQAESGGRLIITSIHAGVFAEPHEAPFDLDLTSETGNTLNDFFEVPANPFALINRVPKGAFWGGFLTQWEEMIQTQMDLEPVLGIQLLGDYKAENDKYCVHVRAELLDVAAQNLSLVILVQESGIEGAQKNGDSNVGTVPEIEDYEFNYVLRETVTPIWGVRAYDAGDPDGTVYTASFGYSLNEEWVAENCSFVAYIYDEDTKQVLNVEEINFPTVD